MALLDFIISLVLLAVAVGLTGYLGMAILKPLLGIFRGTKDKIKVHRAGSGLGKVDALMAKDKPEQALKELRKAFILKIVTSESAISSQKQHHLNVLSRCLVVSEKLGGDAENLPRVEHLLFERAELQALLLKANDSFKNLKSRRKQAGKNIPTWSQGDFQQKIDQVTEELGRNEGELEKELNELFRSLEKGSSGKVTLH